MFPSTAITLHLHLGHYENIFKGNIINQAPVTHSTSCTLTMSTIEDILEDFIAYRSSLNKNTHNGGGVKPFKML